jgi:hypothetical protein
MEPDLNYIFPTANSSEKFKKAIFWGTNGFHVQNRKINFVANIVCVMHL